MQHRDQFEDLVIMRQNTVAENEGVAASNKYNILDFTPRNKNTPPHNLKKKKATGSTKEKIKPTIGGFEDEDEDPNFDEFLADFEKKKKDKEDNEMTELKLHELEK